MLRNKPSEISEKLLNYVRTNNTECIKSLLEHDKDLLTIPYGHPFDNRTILQIACDEYHGMENVKPETIELLIESGSEPRSLTSDNWEPLHYATLNSNFEKLGILVKNLDLKGLNSLVVCDLRVVSARFFKKLEHVHETYSNNALHILLKYANQKPNDFKKCFHLLVNSGVDMTHRDSDGVSALDLIKSGYPNLKIEIEPQPVIIKQSFYFVQIEDEDGFLSLDLDRESANAIDGFDEDCSSCTLLQLCCLKSFETGVAYLLENGAVPYKTIRKNTTHPVSIAIRQDNQKIVELILKTPHLKLPEDILIELQTKYRQILGSLKTDKYTKLVLDTLKEYSEEQLMEFINASDDLNKTVLHYTTYYNSSEISLELLRLGASLTKKDTFAQTPFNFIEPSVLENYLNNCIQLPEKDLSTDSRKNRFTIEINMKTLINGGGPESEFLDHMLKQKTLTHLLKHPVICSYIALKWSKFKWVIYLNLLMYVIAYSSLLFYGFMFSISKQISNGFLLTSLLLLIIREIVQIFIFRLDYLKRIENFLDLFLIGGILYIIASGWVEILLNQNLLVALSIVFLTSTLGIFLELGNLPFFTIKVIVLRRISINFFKYMIFYIFPILAFFFCFYMLMEDKKDTFFPTLYETITMFAGDPDSAYPDNFKSNPIFGHIIYLGFIVLIGIILQNLLIGLAVSDLQEIQREAEFIDKKERVKYITNIERILFKKHENASMRMSIKMFEKLLQTCYVFGQREPVIIVQPYNKGCVYVKDNRDKKEFINDENILISLQNIFKDLSVKNSYVDPIKMLFDKLEKIERLLLMRNQ